jgi:hypothetical protein
MIENEKGLLTFVRLDGADKWDRVPSLCLGHLTQSGLHKLKRLLDGSVQTIAIEKHYIDRDYRDTFSGFHSKKFTTPSARVIRLHFFRIAVSLVELREKKIPAGSYLGYSIIRPTRPNCIGRTLLDPSQVHGIKGTICRCNEKVSIQGTELKVSGFPFISQDVDATVCAESATWMVMRYFSNRYPSYREMHPFEITTATQNYAQGERVYPSRGLHLWQMAETLRREGFAPVIYSRAGFKEDFDDLLYTYIESGFPVFASLKRHVIVAFGHISDYSGTPPSPSDRWLKSSAFNRGFIVNDDNHFPYQRIEAGPVTSDASTSRNPMISGYSIGDILAFAVPLPEKVFLAAEEFSSLVQTLLEDHQMGIDANSPTLKGKSPILLRRYLTTVRSFKENIQSRGMGGALAREVYHDLPLPHFIWVCEFTTPGLYKTGDQKIWGEVIWDATRNAYEPSGFLAVHYPEKLWVDQGSALNQARNLREWTISSPSAYPVLRSNLLEL